MNIIKARIFESIVLQSKPLHSRTKPIPTMKMRTQHFRQWLSSFLSDLCALCSGLQSVKISIHSNCFAFTQNVHWWVVGACMGQLGLTVEHVRVKDYRHLGSAGGCHAAARPN